MLQNSIEMSGWRSRRYDIFLFFALMLFLGVNIAVASLADRLRVPPRVSSCGYRNDLVLRLRLYGETGKGKLVFVPEDVERIIEPATDCD